MKTRFTSIAFVILVSLVCITNVSARNYPEKYHNIICDSINNTKTITVYLNESDKCLKPQSRYDLYYDTNGKTTKRIEYKWDANRTEWIPSQKYEYVFGKDYQLNTVYYVKWNKKENMWNEKVFTEYIYSTEGVYLSMNIMKN